MINHKFHSGPPPHIGWWLTKFQTAEWWRWWDGEAWSWGAGKYANSAQANICAGSKASNGPEQFLWSHYYPANARVPRIKP